MAEPNRGVGTCMVVNEIIDVGFLDLVLGLDEAVSMLAPWPDRDLILFLSHLYLIKICCNTLENLHNILFFSTL